MQKSRVGEAHGASKSGEIRKRQPETALSSRVLRQVSSK